MSIFSHDTPPPILVTDGSLIVESKDRLTPNPIAGHFHYRDVQDRYPDIVHVRVFKDNGEMIYQDLEAAGSSVDLIAKNDGGAEVGRIVIARSRIPGPYAMQSCR